MPMERSFDEFCPAPHPLKKILKQARYPQAAAAQFCGVATKYMGLILNGHQKPNPKVAAKMDEAVAMLKTEIEANGMESS